MTPRLLRAYGLRLLRNLDAKMAPVDEIWGDRKKPLTPPFITPPDDPSVGSAGSSSLTVIVTLSAPPPISASNWGPWSYTDLANVPAGPQQYAVAVMRAGEAVPLGWYVPTLTGNEEWHPHGHHPYSRLHYSQVHGLILDNAPGLLSNSVVSLCCTGLRGRARSDDPVRWRAVFDNTMGNYVAWNDTLRTDMIHSGNQIFALDNSTFPPKRGGLLATIPQAWWDAGHKWESWGNEVSSHVIFVPKTNELWCFTGSTGLFPVVPGQGIWTLKLDGSNQTSVVSVPQAIQDKWLPDNLCMTSDVDNGRVMIAQSRHVRVLDEWLGVRAPLDVYEVDPVTRVFSNCNVPDISALLIGAEIGGRKSFMHLGGITFAYMNHAKTPNYDASTVTTTPASSDWPFGIRWLATENTEVHEFKIPAKGQRQLSFTRHECRNADGSEWASQHWNAKHSHWDSRGDRVYQCGGDIPYALTSLGDSGFSQNMNSLLPDDPTSIREEQPWALPYTDGWQPIRPDEVGFVHDAVRDIFWLTQGMAPAAWEIRAGGPYPYQSGITVDPATDTVTLLTPSAQWQTGDCVQMTTSSADSYPPHNPASYGKTIPSGNDAFSSQALYWIRIDDAHGKLAYAYGGAVNNQAIDFTGAGTATYALRRLASDLREVNRFAVWDPKGATHRWSQPQVNNWITNLKVWPTGENAKHASRDEATDRIVRVGSYGGAMVLNVIRCGTGISNPQIETRFLRFSRNTPPAYVQADMNLGNLGSYIATEYTALDPATGFLYFFNWFSGDLYYADTRATPTIGSDGMEDGHLHWIGRFRAQNETENQGHLAWCDGKLFLALRKVGGRARLYSWAPGEANLTEHVVPYDCHCNQICTYKAGGKEKLFLIGSADTPRQHIADGCYFTAEPV